VDASRILDATRAGSKDAELQHLRGAQAMKEQQQAEQSATRMKLQRKLSLQSSQLEMTEQAQAALLQTAYGALLLDSLPLEACLVERAQLRRRVAELLA